MKTLFISFLLLLLISSCAEKDTPQITDEMKAGLRADAKEFMETLKGVLVKEIQTNGIVSAVAVCSDTAQLLTNNYGVKKGIYIKRVTFKNRNADNTPDDFESKVLKQFEELHSSNKIDQTTEYAEVIDDNGVKTLRFMKPIILQAECLNCHGTKDQIADAVKEVINNKYPDDKAKGYNIGDLRGAISVKKVL